MLVRDAKTQKIRAPSYTFSITEVHPLVVNSLRIRTETLPIEVLMTRVSFKLAVDLHLGKSALSKQRRQLMADQKNDLAMDKHIGI
jgi:hypothetical protein